MEDDKIRDSMNDPMKNQGDPQADPSAEPAVEPQTEPQEPQGEPQTEPREPEHRDSHEGEHGSGHSDHHGSSHHSSHGSGHHSSHSGSHHSSHGSSHHSSHGSGHGSHHSSHGSRHHSSHSSSRKSSSKTKKKENYKKKQLRKVDKKSIFWLSCLLFLILVFSLISYLYNSTDLFDFMKKTGSGNPAVTETEAPTSEETSETPEEKIPEGVKAAAAEVVSKATAHAEEHSGHRIIRFIVSSDAHQDNDNDMITKGTRELGWAQAEILGQLDVDFVASLGDYAWGSYDNTVAEVAEQIRTYKELVGSKFEDECQLWLEGNHDDGVYSLERFPDTPRMNATVLHNLIYSQNSDVVYDAAHPKDGYFYKDFEHLKVRVICLNTEQGDGDGGFVEDYQLKWFAETALDMSGKSDWSVLTMAHHPLDYGFYSLIEGCVGALDAFVNGSTFSHTTQNGMKISVDFSDKTCRYIAHFHGHTHAYTVLPIQKRVEGVAANTNAYEIGIPNACYYRNNQNLGNTNPNIARFATTYTHHKLDEDGKRTSFSVVTICLEDGIIYVDNYGVGVDREVNY